MDKPIWNSCQQQTTDLSLFVDVGFYLLLGTLKCSHHQFIDFLLMFAQRVLHRLLQATHKNKISSHA